MTNCQPLNRVPLKAESKTNGPASNIMTKTFPEQFERMLFVVNENVRLWETWNFRNEEMQSIVNQTRRMWEFTQLEPNKSRPCERCPKLERRVSQLTQLERRVRFQENLITKLTSLATRLMEFVPKNHLSCEVLIQEANNLMRPVQVDDATTMIEKPTFQTKDAVTTKVTDLAPEMNESNVSKDEYADDSMVMKSPEGRPRLDSLERSPIVKRSRSKKRRLKCVSTKKRNKLENGESMVNPDSDIDELEVVSYSSKSRLETPDMLDVKNDVAVAPFDKTEELETTTVEEPSLTGMIDIVEPTQKVSTRHGRLTFCKPDLNEATIEQISVEKEKTITEKKSPLNVIISSKNNAIVNGSVYQSPDKRIKANVDEDEKLIFKNLDKCKKMIVDDEIEKSVFHNPDKYNKVRGNETKQKTKWNLTKSRAPTNTKYKQTLLTTATLEKKTDLSTSQEFNGGLLPTTEAKKNAVNISPMKICDKENTIEQTFNPVITSTANDLVTKSPVKADKLAKFAKYENNIVDNSFDVIPKTSPNYKYRRDAVRKKNERRKLPGQACDCCNDYYCHLKDEVGETQAKITMDKFSRHRDKFPIKSYTPEGFWNPVFDMNDIMLEVSRK